MNAARVRIRRSLTRLASVLRLPLFVTRFLTLLVPLCAAWLCVCDSAWARPGGGQSYSGHSSGPGGGGGGGGGGELVFVLIQLIFAYPAVGVPLAIIVAFVIWRVRREGLNMDSWDTGGPPQLATPGRAAARQPLSALRALDPDFSQVVFEDFAYRLYAAAHRARADQRALAGLAPYLSENVRQSLALEQPSGVSASHVVVGAMRIASLQLPDAADASQREVSLALTYESNVTLGEAPSERTFYLRERWRLARDRDARTKPPDQTERLGCPNCGAPFESSDSGRCKYCDQVVGNGRFAWLVTHRTVLTRELRPPALTSDVAEVGTSRPSVVAPDEQSAWEELQARDPALSEDDLRTRLQLIYDTLNHAYSQLDLAAARGLLSDGMFDYLRYWTDAYRAEGLRNVLDRMRITRVQRVKVVSDRYFDAVTFRVWASGLDYTIDVRTQQRLSGSAERMRDYSEYWTLIRAAAAHGQARGDASCPSCAAPLNITMAGNCTYCGAHITRGEFDWVLSKIEQDEAYEG